MATAPDAHAPAPTTRGVSDSFQPRMVHSLHPLGYGHLVASGTGECGDRRPGPPDPLPGFAPGCPGPVVFWICPGTLCFDIFYLLHLKLYQWLLPFLGT